MSYLEFL